MDETSSKVLELKTGNQYISILRIRMILHFVFVDGGIPSQSHKNCECKGIPPNTFSGLSVSVVQFSGFLIMTR